MFQIDYSTEQRRYIISLITILIILVLSYIFIPIRFETNDDSGIMYIVAGYLTGLPSEITIYTNVIYGCILKWFYTMLPMIAWYTIFHLVFIFLSCFFILKSLLKIANKRQLPIVMPLGLYLIFHMIAISYSSIMLQFTTTPTILGTASLIILFTMYEGETEKSRIIDIISICIMFFFSYIFRPHAGIVMFGLLLGMVIYKHLLRRAGETYLLVGCFIVAIVGISFSANLIYEKNTATFENFHKYNMERAQYMDYPRPSYVEGKEIYSAIGWNEDLHNLVGRWFFLDRNVNVDTFKQINTYTKTDWTGYATRSLKSSIYDVYSYAKSILYGYVPARIIYLSIIILTGLNLIAYIYQTNRNKLNFFLIITCFAGFHLAIIYFCYTGRMPLRVFLTVAIPTFLILFFQLVYSFPEENFRFRKVAMSVLIVLGFGALGLLTLKDTIHTANNELYKNLMRSRNVLEQYVIQNSENIYIYDYPLALSGDPWIVYPDKKPTNYFFWGGSMMFSPPYTEQLLRNGLTDLYADKFLEENCYYLTIGEPNASLVSYMKNKYGITEIITVDKVDVATVYKFIR